jgi:nucleotidyltransferase substrate binding protein (TIGR01987 family)
MEPTPEGLQIHLASLKKALGTLEEAIAQPKSTYLRDTVIKRFEYVFELSWKAMKLAGNMLAQDPRSPKDAARVAFKMGWIDDPEPWFNMLTSRNETVHTYNEELAEEVYAMVIKFPPMVHQLLGSLEKIC